TRQAAKKGPPAAAPEKRFPLVPVLGGVGAVAALAAVAVFALGRGGAAGGPDSSDVATANTTAAGPTPGSPIAAASPGVIRPPPPRSDTTPRRETAATIATPPGQPAAAATVSFADSLRAADDLYDASQFAPARRTAMFVWTGADASGAQKARAARLIATSYGEEDNSEQMVTWYRNSLRYDRNNQQVLNILRQLGVEP
ncbi:MAG: hypothetical protein HY705_06605, partial [Gemmatimonadetes bacterium]|nr:hypothetical protein [Gemmatimonadota bacterium]